MARKDISIGAVALILRCEVSDEATYSRTLTHLTWPGGASGVTGGIGYDFGYESAAQIQADWGDMLPPRTVARLILVCCMTATKARDILPSVADIVIPYDAALHVFETRNIPRYTDLTLAAFPSPTPLAPDSLGALVSLVFNRGPGVVDSPSPAPPGSRSEMRMIRAALAADKPTVVPSYIRQMKRLWIDAHGKALPGDAGLLTRRDDEASLFELGLGGTRNGSLPIVFVPTAPLVSYAAPSAYEIAAMNADQLRQSADGADDAVLNALARTA